MPSSISSSDARPPSGPWFKTWLLAFLLAGGVLGGMEAAWRRAGNAPSVVDDKGLWSSYRRQVDARSWVPSWAKEGGDKVVLIGTSRILLGFNTKAFRERFPQDDLIQLAVEGRHPIAVLRDLAEDERFDGILLCEIFDSSLERIHRNEMNDHVQHFHHRSNPFGEFESYLKSLVQERFVVVHPNYGLRELLRRGIPSPPYLITHGDRSKAADYRMINLKALQTSLLDTCRLYYASNQVATPERWLRESLEVEPLVKRIQARGGRVVFIRFPSTGAIWDEDQKLYPKARYWDQLASRTGAETIHFRDVASLADFDCPDMSHLDGRDTARFTLALADELVRRGVLRPGGPRSTR